MFLDHCMFDISVSEQSHRHQCCAMCVYVQMRENKGYKSTYPARTLVLQQFDALFQCRAMDKGEISHNGDELPNIHNLRFVANICQAGKYIKS